MYRLLSRRLFSTNCNQKLQATIAVAPAIVSQNPSDPQTQAFGSWRKIITPTINGYEVEEAKVISKHNQNTAPSLYIYENNNTYNREGTLLYTAHEPVSVDLLYRSTSVLGQINNKYSYRTWTVNGVWSVLTEKESN